MSTFKNVISVPTGLVFILLMSAYPLHAEIKPEGTWGPAYTISGGLHLDNISTSNKVIYDNDWFMDIIDAGYIVAKHKLGECDLRGIIVTADFYFGNGGLPGDIKEFTTFRNTAIANGITTVPQYSAGANEMLERPGSGKISETSFTPTDGSKLIIAEAKKCTPESPLVIFIGGPATTVATALLQDPTIADKIVALMCDITIYNTEDDWAIYVVAQRTRFFAYPFILNHGYSPELWAQMPNNELCNHFRSDQARENAVGDGALVAWFFDNSLVSNVQKKNMTGLREWKDASSSTYGFLYIENSTANFDGTKMCELMVKTLKNPAVYEACTKTTPAAPSSLIVTTQSPGRLKLDWTNNSSNEDGYKIERKSGSNGSFTEIGSVAANVHSYTDTNAVTPLQYVYRVKAYNCGGASASGEVSGSGVGIRTPLTGNSIGATVCEPMIFPSSISSKELTISGIQGSFSVAITDMSGRRIYAHAGSLSESGKIATPQLSKGLYVVNVRANGRVVNNTIVVR
jgi:hypothetical protein